MMTLHAICRLTFLPAIVTLSCLLGPHRVFAGDPPSANGIEFFENKIRPVLSQYCYECHSSDAKKLRGGLLLDSKKGLLQGGDNGPVLVPGKPNESLIIKALRHEDDLQMPPRSKKLSNEIIADFVRWISMGAPDPREGKVVASKKIDIEKGRSFWSFQPLGKVTPPAVSNQSWIRTPVDRFILAKLEAQGLAPNAPLSRERLIRRVYFDLLGLPPSWAEVEEFVNDNSPDAYEKLIDRLLDNEHFGERWARHWLDLVRFAESHGLLFDGIRPSAYHYRDFVIKAFNQDMPFNEFVRWQIAGDYLQPKNPSALAATGFLAAGVMPNTVLTAKEREVVRYNQLDDMVATIGTSMLGLTLGCARCHAHKYDPIPQEDYYRLVACFSHTDAQDNSIDPNPEGFKKAKAKFDQEHTPLVMARAKFEKVDLPVRLREIAEAGKDTKFSWISLEAVPSSKRLRKTPMGNLYQVQALTYLKDITGIRIEGALGKKFVPVEFKVTAAPLDETSEAVPVKLRPLAAGADPVATVVYETATANGFDGGTVLTFSLRCQAEDLEGLTLSITTLPQPQKLEAASESQKTGELYLLLAREQGKLTAKNRAGVLHWLRAGDPEMDKVYKAVETHAKNAPLPVFGPMWSAVTVKGKDNKGGDRIRGADVHFLIRGDPEKRGSVMTPGFAQVLMKTADGERHWTENADAKDSGAIPPRVALANWITDVDRGAGHLLARVIVNRLWQHHLGRGIVTTPNDFGVQGEAPTHPELLEYLASELVNNGWKLKPIHKLIMTSAVYMQAGNLNAANMKADPQNRWRWRRPVRRLEAEAIRDSILAVSGTLDRTVYGPSFPEGFTARRSIYLTITHTRLMPLLHIFDVPDAAQSVGERSVTTVPTQSLAFLNSPIVRQAAVGVAKRIRAKGPETAKETIELAYMTVLSRRPTAVERDGLVVFLERQAKSYGNIPEAREMALVDCCQVLLCLNEFIFVE